MERTGIHFVFLCFVLIAFLSLVSSEYKLYNSRSRLKYAGVQHIQSADVEERNIHYLLSNQCKFFIVEKTVFYACPKRPTRFPFLLHNEVFRLDNDHKEGRAEYSHSETFSCPFPFGSYPNSKDCRKYYLCIFDKPRTMTCDSSKLYDEYKEECAEKSSVDCGDRTGGVTTKGTTLAPGQKTTSGVKTTTKKVEKFKCPYTWGTFPNPKDCTQYYLCLNKRHTLKKCKPTELYDTETNECRDEDEVDCGSRFNPREKTTKPPTTTAATTPNPTTGATTRKEETTSTIFEESTSQSSSGNTSDEGATESSTSIEVSPSSELMTTLADETESTDAEITSEEPAQFTEEPEFTDDDNSETDNPQLTTEEPEITVEDTSYTDKPEPSSENPIITAEDTSDGDESEPTSENAIITDDTTLDIRTTELTTEKSEIADYTSESDNLRSTSDNPEITDNDVSDKAEITDENTSGTSKLEPSSELPIVTDGVTSGTKERELTTGESLEVTGTTNKPTEEDSSVSQHPDSKSTTPGKLGTTDNGSDHSEAEVTTIEDNISKEPHTTENARASETAEQETSSKESEAPTAETTSSAELSSSLPDENTVSDEENFTDGGEKTDYTTEETSASFQPESTADTASSEEPFPPTENEISKDLPYSSPSIDFDNTDEVTGTSVQSESTAEEKFTPEVSQATDIREISSSSDEVETSPIIPSVSPKSFVCPKSKGNFPHQDCSMYYACRKGSYTIEQCQSGTLFDSMNGMCDNEEDVDCDDRIRPDGNQLSTVTYISSPSPTDRPITEIVSDKDISSEFSKSFENTDKTVDYTSSEISETESTSGYNTKKTDGTSYIDSTTGSTENFETPGTSSTDGTVETESATDYETFKTSRGDEVVDTSESQSTLIFSTQGTGDSGSSTEDKTSAVSTENYSTGDTSESFSTADYVTKEAISSTDRENIETTEDYSSEKSTGTYSTETMSETDTAVDYSTEDTSYRTQDEISVESTTGFIKDELSTQSIAGDNEHGSTSETTEGDTGDSSTEDQSTSFISETTYSDSPTTDHTDVSVTGTDVASETHNTEEVTSSRTGDDEISTTTEEPSSQDTNDETTSHRISSVGTTAEEIINDLTSSELPISTKEKDTSLFPGTTQPSSDKPIVSEITVTKSYESSETTQDNFPSSKEMTPSTKVPDTTTHLPEEITVSTVKPKEICLATDTTCMTDKDGNVFRCPKSHGHFPHPWDASRFLHCDNFRIHVLDCPPGLRFDPKHNICTWAAAGEE